MQVVYQPTAHQDLLLAEILWRVGPHDGLRCIKQKFASSKTTDKLNPMHNVDWKINGTLQVLSVQYEVTICV